MDDYTILGHERVFENLVRVLQDDLETGIAGVSKLLPPDAGWFMRRIYKQMPRTGFPVVEETTLSDIATTTCMAMRRSLYLEVGGQNTSLIRGTDPELRHKVRQRGLKVVIAAGTWCYKPQAHNLRQFIRTEWRRGLAQGWTYWNFPELMDGMKVNQRTFTVQLARYIVGIPWVCFRLKPLLALAKILWCTTLVLTAFPSFREKIGTYSGVTSPRGSRVIPTNSEIQT